MIHLGDITKIKGDNIPPVDVITFGSPCQDLSIAGKRAGLSGERSGLFMEAVRIIKEMREATNGEYPKYAVWENVPGAFSSNGGEDFRAVLEELARVEEPNASIPRPSGRGGRWGKAGAIAGNGWSLAWRQLDAQYWGVPQRRKRIALVADFGGQRAAEILFERTGVSGNPDQSIPTWKEIAGLTANCPTGNDSVVGGTIPINTQIATRYISMGERTGLGIGEDGDPAYTLQAKHEHGVCYCIAGNIVDRADTAGANGLGAKEEVGYTLNTIDRPAVAYKVFDAWVNGDGKIVPTITGDHESRVNEYTAILTERYKNAPIQTTTGTLSPGAHAGSYNGQDAYNDMLVRGQDKRLLKWIVRRLTPTECERLQGYPDGWTDIGDWTDSKGKKHKCADSPRYKALGNSIALPQWYYVLGGIADRLPDNATLGSLFDGIGGFPYVWTQLHRGRKELCVWASEIEEFPIAVTKKWFSGE